MLPPSTAERFLAFSQASASQKGKLPATHALAKMHARTFNSDKSARE